MNRDASSVHPSETIVGYIDPSGRGRGSWSRALKVEDELGPRQPVPQAEPVDETWASLIANGCAFVFLLLAIGMALVVIGGMRP